MVQSFDNIYTGTGKKSVNKSKEGHCRFFFLKKKMVEIIPKEFRKIAGKKAIRSRLIRNRRFSQFNQMFLSGVVFVAAIFLFCSLFWIFIVSSGLSSGNKRH